MRFCFVAAHCILFLIALIPISLGQDIPNCSKGHCKDADPVIKALCDRKGWGADVMIPTRDTDGTLCQCPCSCLAYGTPIKVPRGEKAINEFVSGDTILVVSDLDGSRKWVPGIVQTATPAYGGARKPVDYAIRIKVGGTVLISNAAHRYVLADGSTRRADRLTVNDQLMHADFKPVKVESVAHGTFFGSFANVTTAAPETDKWGHIYSSAGILSCDFYLQQTSNDVAATELPQVGSVEYEAKFGNYKKVLNSLEPTDKADRLFVPAADLESSPNFGSIVPDDAAVPVLGMRYRALDDNVSRLQADKILRIFGAYYPDIEYVLNWSSNTNNAYAKYTSSGKKMVEIHGGLVRNPYMFKECLAFVVAHETAHHEGGAPRYPNDARSCEGQSDYYGASVIMREVYPGREYLDYMVPATNQFYDWLTKGLAISQDAKEVVDRFASDACSHPPAACRRDTLNAAIDLAPKPSCAGPTSLTSVAAGDCGCGNGTGTLSAAPPTSSGKPHDLLFSVTRRGGLGGKTIETKFTSSQLPQVVAERLHREVAKNSKSYSAENEKVSTLARPIADDFGYEIKMCIVGSGAPKILGLSSVRENASDSLNSLFDVLDTIIEGRFEKGKETNSATLILLQDDGTAELSIFSSTTVVTKDCEQPLCSQIDEGLKEVCKRLGWPPGTKIVTIGKDGVPCLCNCY